MEKITAGQICGSNVNGLFPSWHFIISRAENKKKQTNNVNMSRSSVMTVTMNMSRKSGLKRSTTNATARFSFDISFSR